MSAVSHRARSIMRELKIFNFGWNGDVCRTLPQIADEDMQDIFYALDDSGDFKVIMRNTASCNSCNSSS
jgi:hypothetical protein